MFSNSSQNNQFKLDPAEQKNGYLSLSQKKKNQQYWSLKKTGKITNKQTKEEQKQMYHVTIQIDPNITSNPPNR